MKTALISALLVGSGGFFGAMLRYGISGLVQKHLLAMSTFPYGTLVVNIIGCLMIGLLMGLVEARQLFMPEFRNFAVVGLLGGFTTFSTFGFETFKLAQDGEWLPAAFNVGVHIIACLTAVWFGYSLASWR